MRCLALRPFAWLAAGLARLPQGLLLGLANIGTALAWPLLARRRRIAARNLELCFPEMDAGARKRLLRANLRATVMGVFELARGWFAPAWALPRARIDGLQEVADTLARGEGVFLLSSHFTHNEFSARLLAEALPQPVRVVVRRNNNACLEAELERARRRVFGPSLEKKDVRALMRALQHGEVVVTSGDQDFSYNNAFVPFFDVPAATLLGSAQLAARGRARVFLSWPRREADGSYTLQLEPAWPDWEEAEPAQAAAIYMAALEAKVRQAPEQYLWVHRRFKTRPPGEASLYA
jgi:KDO2-lipid IV(A) lauroyltransferase